MKKWPVYAPVIIPTLCRFEHFKRCIDSLSRCTGAEYTDVYIGLDYPVKDSHWEGYQKICDYVEQLKGFNHLYVLKRTYNYGAIVNVRDLLAQVKKHYDRYILSEDDNEFSPNFLEYMNAGLEKYKDDPDVLRICGCNMSWYADFEECMKTYGYNAYPAMDFCAWGIGRWFSKVTPIPFTKESVLNSFSLTRKTIRYGYCSAIDRFLHHLHKDSQFPDICFRLYCVFNHKYCIFPRVSKVKNWGFDGTGENVDSDPRWINEFVLDTSPEFELDDFEIKEYKEVKSLIKEKYDALKIVPHYRRAIMEQYLFFRITGMRMEDVPPGQRARNYLFKNLFKRLSSK